jgi:uncharacterized protein (TIGR03382 family)
MRMLLTIAGVLAPSVALAHVTLTFPPPRTSAQKDQVCGAANSVRGTNVTTLPPGATISVTWLETIDHPGHYRIAFDEDGQGFPVPLTADEDTTGMPTVVMDLIPDIQGNKPPTGRPYSVNITLPNIECNNCTLQLTQLMTDKPPYRQAPPTDDIYYQCADITLSASAPDAGPNQPTPDAGVDPGNPMNPDGEVGGGCSTGAGAGLAVAAMLAGLRRRRKR